MLIADEQLTAGHVLGVVRHDIPYLFLGAAFTTVGIAAGLYSLLRSKADALLLWFAVLVVAYGQRLWLQSGTLHLLCGPSVFLSRLTFAINFLIPIPAVFYFEAAGFLGRYSRSIAYAMSTFFLGLFAATFVFGTLDGIDRANNVVIIAALCLLVFQSIGRKESDADFIIVRRGLFIFAAVALSDNIAGIFHHYPFYEPIGFVFFLVALGIVASRRTLRTDQQLAEVQKELDVARRIQTSNLPQSYPASPAFRVASRYVPMTSVAGDFYDYLMTEPDEAGLLIADVSGHGVPAALIASMVKLSASMHRSLARDPAALLAEMNTALCGNAHSQFVTAAYVHLDARTASLRYAAAAHPPMLLVRNGEVHEIVENGLMLAAFPFAQYAASTHPLEQGDRLVLYTDGIIEAANAQMVEFGQERLRDLLKENQSQPAESVADAIIAAVQRWSAKQDDDLTLLICDYAGIR